MAQRFLSQSKHFALAPIAIGASNYYPAGLAQKRASPAGLHLL